MKKMNGFIIAVLFIFSADAWAQQHVGRLKTVSGDVQIQRGHSFVESQGGVQLMNADLLITGNNGYAGILFTDGTAVTLGPDTRFHIKKYAFEPDVEIYDFSMYLKKGSAIYSSGKIGKLSPASVNLSTPRATVGVRGTRFLITVK